VNRKSIYLAFCAVTLLGIASCSGAPALYDSTADKAAISASLDHLIASVNAKDLDGIMQYYVSGPSLLVFDVVPPRQYAGSDAYKADWKEFLAQYPTGVHAAVSDFEVETDGTMAYSHGIFTTAGNGPDGKPMPLTVRVTDVFKKVDGKWLAVHEHVSVPVDLATGKPDLTSKP
jgi:ketosteroid isomerase-like protein